MSNPTKWKQVAVAIFQQPAMDLSALTKPHLVPLTCFRVASIVISYRSFSDIDFPGIPLQPTGKSGLEQAISSL